MAKSNTPFEEITITWNDKKYSIAPNRVMGAIARVEEHVTLKELVVWLESPGGARFSRLASAYSALLRYAGVSGPEAAADEIYGEITNPEKGPETLMVSLMALMAVMIPPKHMQAATEKELAEGKSTPTAASSSEQPSEPRSALPAT